MHMSTVEQTPYTMNMASKFEDMSPTESSFEFNMSEVDPFGESELYADPANVSGSQSSNSPYQQYTMPCLSDYPVAAAEVYPSPEGDMGDMGEHHDENVTPMQPYGQLQDQSTAAAAALSGMPPLTGTSMHGPNGSISSISSSRSDNSADSTGSSTATAITAATSNSNGKNNSNSNSTAAPAASKPPAKRKRENRYKNAPPSVLSRRRAQNRASQRAYRERKDQRIKDLEQMLSEARQRNDSLTQAYTMLQSEFLKLKMHFSSAVVSGAPPQPTAVATASGMPPTAPTTPSVAGMVAAAAAASGTPMAQPHQHHHQHQHRHSGSSSSPSPPTTSPMMATGFDPATAAAMAMVNSQQPSHHQQQQHQALLHHHHPDRLGMDAMFIYPQLATGRFLA